MLVGRVTVRRYPAIESHTSREDNEGMEGMLR